MDFRRCWNRINLSLPMNNKGIKKVGLVSENRGYGVLSEKYISGLAQSLWMQTTQYKRGLKPNRTPLTAPFIMPCYLILKGVFFINNFVILSVVPAGENMLLSFISLQGHRLGVQCLACRHFHRTDASFLMGLSLVFPHEGQLLQATILPSYLILKGYFSLILIMLVFLHFRASDWTLLTH